MPLYEMTAAEFRPLTRASFSELKVRERDDLQRLLRTQIDVLGDDLYVLTEEFGDWDESRRRIDLLAIDPQANLVVIELKRTNDGGHMELQAIRYASMVSAMTFERAEQIHGEFLTRIGEPTEEARTRMLTFLGWEEPDEEAFAPDVRMVLVSEDFGKELTTAVLWLRERDIDIRCVRLRPYLDGEKRLIDVQQIIPLPEAHEYQVQLREKEKKEQIARSQHNKHQPFWQEFLEFCRVSAPHYADLQPGKKNFVGRSSGIPGINFNFRLKKDCTNVELHMELGGPEETNRAFDQLYASKEEIEKSFGETLNWQRLDTDCQSLIEYTLKCGDYLSPKTQWPKIQSEMVEKMRRLEDALKPALGSLKLYENQSSLPPTLSTNPRPL